MTATPPYTIVDSASAAEQRAVCAAVLRVLWPHLSWLEIDLVLQPNRPDAAESLAALEPYRKRSLLSRRPTVTARLVPGRDDAALDAAAEIAGSTIGSTGLARTDARLIYDASDGGTSCVFRLTDDQLAEVQEALRDLGMRPDLLVPFDRTRRVSKAAKHRRSAAGGGAAADGGAGGLDSTGLAAEILDARVELKHGKLVNAILFVPRLVAGLVEYSTWWGRPEVSCPCSVVVFRRADGVELVRYDHRYAAEAYDHLADVLGRLRSESATTFTQSLSAAADQRPWPTG